MGLNGSIPISSQVIYQQQQIDRVDCFNSYLRDFSILTYGGQLKNKKYIIRKLLILENHQELEQFYNNFIKIDRKPFNLIYPINILEWTAQANNHNLFSKINLQKICSQSSIAAIYFEQLLNNLAYYCLHRHSQGNQNKSNSKHIENNNNKNLLKNIGRNIDYMQEHPGLEQSQIWFILNQISRGIQLMKNNQRAHWNITPQTIFYNNNQNWYLHDSYFVIGPNHHNFLKYKIKLKNPFVMSYQLINNLQKDIILDYNFGISQDIYCLGYCILYMMGITKNTQKDPLKRHQFFISLFQYGYYKLDRYTIQLKKLILDMIEPFQIKRIQIDKLRQQLLPKQKKIIDNSIRKKYDIIDDTTHQQTIYKIQNKQYYDKNIQNNRISNKQYQDQNLTNSSYLLAYLDNLPNRKPGRAISNVKNKEIEQRDHRSIMRYYSPGIDLKTRGMRQITSYASPNRY